MIVKNIVALEEVALDLDIGELFYENQNIGLGNYMALWRSSYKNKWLI
ncbi:MAG: hypothetical protein ACQERD_04960 [Campylobacterota bacterium]